MAASRSSQSPRTVLVTGGAGFIGAAAVRALLDRDVDGTLAVRVVDDLSAGERVRLPEDPRVSLLVGDVTQEGVLEEALGDGADVALHLAGRVGVRRVLADPDGCRAVTESAARAWTRALERLPFVARPRLLSASTSEVYMDAPGPLSETAPLRDPGGRGRWAYAGSRVVAERRLDAASHLWSDGRGPVHLRFFNVTGPGQDASSGMVLPTFVERARSGESLPVHGAGDQVRTLAHVDDVAHDLAQLCFEEHRLKGGALNLGGDARTTILELALACAEAAGRGAEAVVHVDPRRGLPNFEEVRWREPDLRRARSLGLVRRTRPLASIVADSMARHPEALATP